MLRRKKKPKGIVDARVEERMKDPSGANLTQALHRGARFYPDQPALICDDRETSWRDFKIRVSRLAAGLRSIGVGEDTVVSVLAINSDRFIELIYAIWWAGGILNSLNIRWAPKELAYGLSNSESRILFVDEAFVQLVPSLEEHKAKLDKVAYLGDSTSHFGTSTEQLIADFEPMEDVRRSNQDLAAINYTGGTTGFPKGVQLTHIGMYANALNMLIENFVGKDENYMMIVPLFHVSGLSVTTSQLMGGGTAIIVPVFTPENAARAIETYKIKHISLVPTMIQMFVDDPATKNYDLSSVKRLGYGASAISEGVLARAMETFPGAKFVQAYGATELAASGAYLPDYYHTEEGIKAGKLRSNGRATFTIDLKIVDENQDEVPRGEVGEIAVRGPGLMRGYHKLPDVTEKAFTKDGFYLTGDGAYMDDDGFIYIVDRMKDMIISGGENVYSTEVENALSTHASVAACAVIAIPDEKWGELVHAVIQVHAGAEVSEEELDAHCRQEIAGYKCPKSYDFIEAMPISAAGKILKTELRKMYAK